jgi:hypothetical protein
VPPLFILNGLTKPIPGTLQEGGAPFQTTHWTVVLEAGRPESDESARKALAVFCDAYWAPFGGYVDSPNEHAASRAAGETLAALFPSHSGGKNHPNSRCAGSDNYAGYMLARHIKPKKIFFHSRLLPHETWRMNRVQHLKTKKGFFVFSDSGFMTYQPQT